MILLPWCFLFIVAVTYGSWIYNYMCNRCLSPPMLWVRLLLRTRCTTLCDIVCQWLIAGWRFSLVSFTNKTDSRYNWNIVESGIKHHKIQPTNLYYTLSWAGAEPTTSVVIGTDCTCSCKSNYHKSQPQWLF
jgi:hypothetical protein